MWLNPQETADLVTFTKKSLMKNFVFCAASFRQINPQNIFKIFKQWLLAFQKLFRKVTKVNKFFGEGGSANNTDDFRLEWEKL